MSDSTLTRASVTLSFRASSGYSGNSTFNSNRNKEVGPEVTLLEAFEEMSRILHICGLGEEALKKAKEAGDRVMASKASKSTTGEGG